MSFILVKGSLGSQNLVWSQISGVKTINMGVALDKPKAFIKFVRGLA